MAYVELGRQFVARESYSAAEVPIATHTGKLLKWPQLLESHFSVVVAPANYGKSTELREQAALLRDSGSRAVFLRLQDVSSVGGFDELLEESDRLSHAEWN